MKLTRILCARTACAALTALTLSLSCTACSTTLKSDENGLYDKKNDIRYLMASTVYEAKARGKKYGEMKLTDDLSVDLYVIPDVEPTVMLATEDNDIVYASDNPPPTLQEMNPNELHVCVDGTTTAHVIHTISDAGAIARMVDAYTDAPAIGNPGYTAVRNFRIRFESPDYPGFYYTLTYVEYASDVVIDGVSYGRYFLMSLFDGIFAPIDGTIHESMGLDEDEATDSTAD